MSTMDIDKLIEELTIEEKIQLLAGNDWWHTFPVPRLNIPSIRMSDGPNGLRGSRFFQSTPSTCFPCGTALAATWNKELLQKGGNLMAEEAYIKGVNVILGPTCNIIRSPLGGRSFETYSEDPVLSGAIASSLISGIQEKDIIACIKHFVCNDQEEDRLGVNAIVTERALREIYLKPFEMAIKQSNSPPKAVMTAYNKVNGVHASQSEELLTNILRKEWGYEGLTMSDWYGCYSAEKSIQAGLDLEMPGKARFRTVDYLKFVLRVNEFKIETIDRSVRNVLNLVKEASKAGIAEGSPEKESTRNPKTSKTLQEIGQESIVLLKNDLKILPLTKDKIKGKKIAIIGPNAKVAQYSGGGSANLNASYSVTPYEAISLKLKEEYPDVQLEYAEGCQIDKYLPNIFNYSTGEIIGKFYLDPPGSERSEPFDVLHLDSSEILILDYLHEKLVTNIFYATFENDFVADESGTYEFGLTVFGTAQLFIDDKLFIDNKEEQKIADKFFFGVTTDEKKNEIYLEKGTKLQIRVEFGAPGTSAVFKDPTQKGALFYGARRKTDPQVDIDNAVKLAKELDYVILCIGSTRWWESEGYDRTTLDLPLESNKLIESILKVKQDTIVVNQSGSPVTMPWVDLANTLVHAWYGGNECGSTISNVIFGDHNPLGKLSVTFPKLLSDNPSYLNFGSFNGEVLYGEDVFVGYRYYEKLSREVLFPFGYGLSYTTFEFKDLEIKTEETNLNLTVLVSNTGDYDGQEVVQVYIEQTNPNIIRPVKELRDFQKVAVKAGETKKVEISISIIEATRYWDNSKRKWISEKDEYKVKLGNSSDNILVEGSFKTEKTKWDL